MNSISPIIEITRSAIHKVSRQNSFGNWVSDETFCSAKGQCLVSDAEQFADELYAMCRESVDGDFADIKARLQTQGEAPVAAAEPYQEPFIQRREEPESSPFVASAAPPAEEYPDKAALEQAKVDIEQAKAELYKAAGEVLGFQFAPPKDTAHITAPIQTGAPESEPTPRGRRKATTKVEGPAAMEALKASVPPEALVDPKVAMEFLEQAINPTGQFRATTDDLPANIASAPHEPKAVAPDPPKSQAERLDAIVTTLIKNNPKVLEGRAKQLGKDVPSVARGCLAAFMRGFQRAVDVQSEAIPRAGNGKDKPDDPFYEANLPLFEGFARLYSGQMISKAPEEGLKAGESWAQFVRRIDGWPVGFKILAKSVAAQYHPDCATDLLGFLEDTVGKPEPSKSAEIWSFLQLMRIGKPALLAARDAAKKRGALLSEVVAGLDLDLAGEKGVLSHLAGAAVQSGA